MTLCACCKEEPAKENNCLCLDCDTYSFWEEYQAALEKEAALKNARDEVLCIGLTLEDLDLEGY